MKKLSIVFILTIFVWVIQSCTVRSNLHTDVNENKHGDSLRNDTTITHPIETPQVNQKHDTTGLMLNESAMHKHAANDPA